MKDLLLEGVRNICSEITMTCLGNKNFGLIIKRDEKRPEGIVERGEIFTNHECWAITLPMKEYRYKKLIKL